MKYNTRCLVGLSVRFQISCFRLKRFRVYFMSIKIMFEFVQSRSMLPSWTPTNSWKENFLPSIHGITDRRTKYKSFHYINTALEYRQWNFSVFPAMEVFMLYTIVITQPKSLPWVIHKPQNAFIYATKTSRWRQQTWKKKHAPRRTK